MMCFKAGISSFYGHSPLNDFAENVTMSPYSVDALQRCWFSSDVIGEINSSPTWTVQHVPWTIKHKDIARTFQTNRYEVVQGHVTVQGRLIGGCMKVLCNCKGILQQLSGIFFVKPHKKTYENKYKQTICKEYHLEDLPVLCNGSFGHNESKMILPYGALAQIDCAHQSFSILESAIHA